MRSLLNFFLIFLATYLALPQSFAADSCSQLIGSCDYYTCIDTQRLSCGDQGYALGYGRRFCQKFTGMSFAPARTRLEAELFPASGDAWRDEVRSCLQEELETFFTDTQNASCEQLRTFAFASHPHCYTKGPSFCELSPENVVRIGLTIKTDLLTGESFQQIRDTAEICDAQLQARIDTEPKALLRWQLAHYQGLWRLIAADPLQVHRFLETVRP